MSKIRRVFLSHTSEFAKYPEKKSFIEAAIAAVNRAGCVPYDMEYFTARDEKPAHYCIERVRECDVYVGVIGLRYGSPVRDRPDVSYTELEFEAACQVPVKTRLVFLLDPINSLVPSGWLTALKYGDRQERFRQRLSDAGVTCKPFIDARDLEMLLYQALKEDAEEAGEVSAKRVRIDWPKDKSPYPGLLWFNEEYAPLFFGRDREVEAVLAKMCEPQGRLLIVSGYSGTGKSSLVAAGLWRALAQEGRLPGSRKWRWLRIAPGADGRGPIASLTSGLQHAFPQMTARADDLAAALEHDPTAWKNHITTQLTDGQELLLFIDQLEELFTQGYSAKVRQSFLACLVTISGDLRNRLRVVTTIRSDFWGRLAESESITQKINEGSYYLVGPITPTALLEMIQRPAGATGYTFEPGLVDEMLEEAGKEPGNLPLLAYALNQLFERCPGRTFTRAEFQAMGGVAGAIGSKADEVMKALGDDATAAFDRVFAELVHLERDRPPTRQRVPLVAFQNNANATKLIETLAGRDCRILVTGEQGQEPTVEVAHEKLFSAWPKLKSWIDSSGEALRLIDYAEEAAMRWEKTGSHLQELWRSERVREVEQALSRFNKLASPQLKTLLHPQQMLEERLKNETLSHQDRLLIGQKLADSGDTRPGVGRRPDGLPDIVWIDIPGGRITLEAVDHVFEVKPFQLAKYLVTHAQFEAFIKAKDGYRNEGWWSGIERSQRDSLASWSEANSPRERVSWFEAMAFCRWLSHRTPWKVRLPTEWEWQQAATGGDPTREYPWPGEWDGSRCNSTESQLGRTTAVGMYPHGATEQGVVDMAGNLWEWCVNTYEQPETPESQRIDESKTQRVLRGGSWFYRPVLLSVSGRNGVDADYQGINIGFRLAQDLP